MISIVLSTPLAAILSDSGRVPLTIGREAATELGLAALEHLEGTPTESDVHNLASYAARHDESAPARDALVAVLLNASGTLPTNLAEYARAEVMQADWGHGRETPGLSTDPDVNAVPRRSALSERLMAERARRLRPRMQLVVTAILAGEPGTEHVPSWFLERNWIDLRETLVQRTRIEPMRREAITHFLCAQHPAVQQWLQPVEDALVDVATQAILHFPERAPLAPYIADDRVADAIRTAVTFRGEPARQRLAKYLARLAPGTPWYETIRVMTLPPQRPWTV